MFALWRDLLFPLPAIGLTWDTPYLVVGEIQSTLQNAASVPVFSTPFKYNIYQTLHELRVRLTFFSQTGSDYIRLQSPEIECMEILCEAYLGAW
jgi:hypothetical protein